MTLSKSEASDPEEEGVFRVTRRRSGDDVVQCSLTAALCAVRTGEVRKGGESLVRSGVGRGGGRRRGGRGEVEGSSSKEKTCSTRCEGDFDVDPGPE